MKNETKEERKRAKLLYHFMHCLGRLRQRYDLEMTMEEYEALCHKFRCNNVLNTRKDNIGNVEGWLEFKGKLVCFSYMPDAKLIGTVMPAPPPVEGVNQKPKFIEPNEALRGSYTLADFKWIKERLKEAIREIHVEDYADAVLLLDAIISMPTAIKPGKTLKEAEQFISDHIRGKKESQDALAGGIKLTGIENRKKYVTSLECDHCGDVAIKADEKGYFTDGSGGTCLSCGFPGHVSCDKETDPWWDSSQEDDSRCKVQDCVLCEDSRCKV